MQSHHNIISGILYQYPHCLKDRYLLSSLLNDYLPKEESLRNILLLLYFSLNIHKQITNADTIDDFLISRIAKQLEKQYSINIDAAKNGVQLWVECLQGIPLPEHEEQAISSVDNDLVQIPVNPDGIYFPIGVGFHDHGFTIKGVEESDKPCEHKLASLYAIIFSFLQRCLNIEEGLFVRKILDSKHRQANYKFILRLQLLFLYLIKNNYCRDNILNVQPVDGSTFEFEVALESINEYGRLIAKLMGIEYQQIKFGRNRMHSRTVSLSGINGDICVVDSANRINIERQIWYAPNIKYCIKTNHETDLKIILKEAFNFDKFLPGQFTTIKEILNQNNHKIIVMPTGSGKSLIYFFVAILQPCPTLIISPTEILIKDQINNLIERHKFDDIHHIRETEAHNDFSPKNKLIFLTPLVFLSRNLIRNVIRINIDQFISNIVLDEVHCISNWSHDFRPEYLMLSFNLSYFADRTRRLCFTATANYTVVKDLHTQLGFNQNGKDIICPLNLSKSNIFYLINISRSEEENLGNVKNYINQFLIDMKTNCNKQMLVFTKTKFDSELIKNNLYEPDKSDVAVFSSESLSTFVHFARRRIKVLIGDTEVGIGINLPGVTDTLHYGLPISKSQFVQEIGRAGRNGGNSSSTICYKMRDSYIAKERLLLQRNIPIADIMPVLQQNDLSTSDLIKAYEKIIGGIENQNEYYLGVSYLLSQINQIPNSGDIRLKFNKEKGYQYTLSQYMRYLYVLYRVGYLFNWYIVEINVDNEYVDFYIELSVNKELEFFKNFLIEYLYKMGDYRDTVRQVNEASDLMGIIKTYINWHYNQFLYHHREQLMEMVDFLEIYKNKSTEQISEALAEYFSLSYYEISEDTAKYKQLSIRDIIRMIRDGIDDRKIIEIQKSNENEYSAKLDLILLLYNLRTQKLMDVSRFDRLIQNLSEVDYNELLGQIDMMYSECNIQDQILLINALCKKSSLKDVLDSIFNKVNEDRVYFSILSRCGNINL